MSGWLFDPAELPTVAAPLPAWTRSPAHGGCKLRVEHHHMSGWVVRHCGHPTANFPYYVVTQDGRILYNPDNGRGFHLLALAKNFVERMTS